MKKPIIAAVILALHAFANNSLAQDVPRKELIVAQELNLASAAIAADRALAREKISLKAFIPTLARYYAEIPTSGVEADSPEGKFQRALIKVTKAKAPFWIVRYTRAQKRPGIPEYRQEGFVVVVESASKVAIVDQRAMTFPEDDKPR